MTAFSDTDQSWKSYDGPMRLRYNPYTNQFQIQVSVPDGAGGYLVTTANLPGNVRDTRPSPTKWPAGQN